MSNIQKIITENNLTEEEVQKLHEISQKIGRPLEDILESHDPRQLIQDYSANVFKVLND